MGSEDLGVSCWPRVQWALVPIGFAGPWADPRLDPMWPERLGFGFPGSETLDLGLSPVPATPGRPVLGFSRPLSHPPTL